MGETSNLIIKKPIEILTSRADLLPPVVKRDTATSKRVLKDNHSPIKPAAMLQLASIHTIYIFYLLFYIDLAIWVVTIITSSPFKIII